MTISMCKRFTVRFLAFLLCSLVWVTAGGQTPEGDPGLLDAQEQRAPTARHQRRREHVRGGIDRAIPEARNGDPRQERPPAR